MRATRTFTDRSGVTHRNGEEWLIKMEDTEAHIPDVYEEVSATVLSCLISDRECCHEFHVVPHLPLHCN